MWEEVLLFLVPFRSKIFDGFLAHLSRRLKWAIVITHRPLSVVRSSLDFRIFDFFSRTAWWILTKLGRDEVLMVPHKCCCFSARSVKGWIQGGAKCAPEGPLLWETSSSDRLHRTTNRMHQSDLEGCGKKCCCFWFHSEVKFLTLFWRFFGLSHFSSFSCNFYWFLCCKVLNLHDFSVINMFIGKTMLIFKLWCLKNF